MTQSGKWNIISANPQKIQKDIDEAKRSQLQQGQEPPFLEGIPNQRQKPVQRRTTQKETNQQKENPTSPENIMSTPHSTNEPESKP